VPWDVVLRVAIALVAAVLIYLLAVKVVRTMMAPPPPDEPDMTKIEPVELRYRCMVCGTEVTMTGSPDADAPAAPRHCREDMTLLGADVRH
jgi:DNA-directed RNA polymerase subunit RPC12/RpoP